MAFSHKLIVFEGADGVGKTTIARALVDELKRAQIDCDLFAFPGNEDGSLGRHVYQIHHEPSKLGIKSLSPTSKQVLHVAAHIDAIENRFLPALRKGQCIVLDRFWWSTWVYGVMGGANQEALHAMIRLELLSWKDVQPSIAFLVRRKIPFRNESRAEAAEITDKYLKLISTEKDKYPIQIIDNEHTVDESLSTVLRAIGIVPKKVSIPTVQAPLSGQVQLPFDYPTDKQFQPSGPTVLARLSPAKPTIVYDTYWRFAVERQAIFFRRAEGLRPPWTKDRILREHKFTNAYRASDRVSQYLIKHVIYEGDQDSEEVFFRILLFKVFNRIETWQLLVRELGSVSFKTYSFKKYDAVLGSAIDSGERIYSAAYIMPSGGSRSPFKRKHQMHLNLIERMLKDELPHRIADADGMARAFDLIRSYHSIGDFLAYQYVTDLNYSTLTSFSEMEFVIPGPGARDGIRKCFSDLGGLTESEIIKMVAERQEEEFSRLGLNFQSLWGRRLQLIDCQNLFCEVDKYSRVAHPEFTGRTGRTRIKQKFKLNPDSIDYWYPPKWNINHLISKGAACVSIG